MAAAYGFSRAEPSAVRVLSYEGVHGIGAVAAAGGSGGGGSSKDSWMPICAHS